MADADARTVPPGRPLRTASPSCPFRAHSVPLRSPALHKAERRPGPGPADDRAGAGEGAVHRRRPGSHYLHRPGRHEAGACGCGHLLGSATSWARAPGPRGKQGPGGEGEEPGRGRGRAANLPPRALVPPQALNNLQSTFSGFGFINSENVFKVQEPVGPPGVLHLGVATAGCAGAPAPGVRVPSPRADSGGCRARPRTWGGGFGRSPTPRVTPRALMWPCSQRFSASGGQGRRLPLRAPRSHGPAAGGRTLSPCSPPPSAPTQPRDKDSRSPTLAKGFPPGNTFENWLVHPDNSGSACWRPASPLFGGKGWVELPMYSDLSKSRGKKSRVESLFSPWWRMCFRGHSGNLLSLL